MRRSELAAPSPRMTDPVRPTKAFRPNESATGGCKMERPFARRLGRQAVDHSGRAFGSTNPAAKRRRPAARPKVILDLDSEISDGMVQLAMSKQQLDGLKIFHPLVYQRCLCPVPCKGVICGWIKTDRSDPLMNRQRLLPRRCMR